MEAKLLQDTAAFRVCSKCGGAPQPIENFPKRSQLRSKLSQSCAKCCHAVKTEYRENNKESHVKRNQQYYKDNLEKCREIQLRWRLKKFGVTPEWYKATLAAQGGGCAICARLPGKRMLAIDHNHQCCPDKTACEKCRRQLLCERCNWALGVLENAQLLKSSLAYLENHPLKSG